MKDKDKKEKRSMRVLIKTVQRSFKLCFKLLPKLTVQLVFIVLILQIFPLLQNGLFGSIINKITDVITSSSNAANISNVLIFILLYVASLVTSSIFEELRKYIEKRWDLMTDNRLENYTMRKRAGIDIARYEDPDFQNLIYRAFDSGTWPIHSLARGQIENIANIFSIIAASVIVYSISPTLLILSLCAAAPNFIIELKYGYNMYGIWVENSHRQRLYYALRDHIYQRQNVIQTKMLQASEKILSVTKGIMDAFLGDQLKVDRRRLWLSISSNIIMSLGIGYGIYLIVLRVLDGDMQPGTLVFAVASLEGLIWTINRMLRDIAEQYRRTLTAKDIFHIFDVVDTIKEPENAKHISLAKPPLIEFKNVSFKYPSKNTAVSPWIFKDLNFTIEPGQKIGLVGINGAGKSTLIKLLMRVYDPTEGAILVDGVDLKEISSTDWTSMLSVLLQQYSLHEFDIENAIAMGLPNAEFDPAMVIQSAELSGTDDFIKEYPKGYKQQISREFEDGIEPSQGQLQKITLARALYRLKVAQVLVLDEPTAAIDPLAELEIFEQMEKATAGKTLILITHRFNSVKNVDKILVLDGHKLAEQGSHQELIKNKGQYAKMFESQAKGFKK